MKKVSIIALLTALMLIGAMGVSVDAAPTSVGAFNGQAHLNGGFPCIGCPGSFDGTYRGASRTPNVTCVACPMHADFTYSEAGGQCVGNVPAAPLGTANGSYTVTGPTGSIGGNFAWTRVGVTAVMLLSAPLGVGLAGFVPPASCAPTNATVAGVAVSV